MFILKYIFKEASVFRIFVSLIAFLATASFVQAQSNRINATADYALINGNIYTMDAEGSTATAIGIEGDEIVYVGDADGLRNVIGIGTEVIDLKGKMVLPGFVDGHIHAAAGGLIMLGVDLQTDDKDELFARIRGEVESNDDDIILGFGVRFNPWRDGNPTAAMLDEIESERPVYLWAIDGHAAWVNSKALEMAGVDKDTPDTVPGFSFFERDDDGNPTGWIVEIPAQMQVLTSLIDVNPEFMAGGVADWMQRFAAAGITAVHDHGIQGMSQQEGFQMMADFESNGELPIRFVGSYYWNDGSIDPLPATIELSEQFNSELVKATYLKINMDGGDDKWNALYVDPYTDKPDLVPDPIIPVDIVKDAVIRADAAGFNVTCHCFGDLAVRTLLDAVEEAIAVNPERERAHKITHGTLIHPDDYARFAELGVIYDTTGSWMTFDPLMQTIATDRLGADRVKAMFPVNRVVDAGGTFSFGSDWPVSGYVSEYRPLASIEAGVTRQLRGRRDVPPLGGEEAKLPLQLALEAHTINAARGMAMDKEIGSLEVGKKADIVVLDQDLFKVDREAISDVEVLYTIMGGELTFEKGD